VLRRRRPAAPDATPTLALAGAGAIAVVHALSAPSAGIRVTAVASAGGTSARHLAGQLDARRVAPADLPAGADLLVVATPPDTHAALTLQGLAAGADVLVEKPLATTLADADRMVAAAAEPGAPALVCAENLLYASAWQVLMTRRSAMGPLRHLSARTLQPPPDWGHFAGTLEAGGVLLDLGPHPLALVLGLAGEDPVAVRAELSSTRPDGADDDATVHLRFPSGLEATVDVSWTATAPEWSVQAAADDGVVRLELYPDVVVEADGEPVALPPVRSDAADPALDRFGYIGQLADLAAGGTEVALPFGGDRSRTPMQLWRG
jgi:predicted dehydrogenase